MEATTTPDFVQAAVRDFEALAARDAAGMAASYAEDAIADIVPVGVLRGSAEIRQFFEGLFAAFPDMATTYDVRAASGNTVVIEWRSRGTFSGEAFQGIEPNGKTIDSRGVDVMQIENDRIAHNTAYYDGMNFARQLGMMPPEDSGAEKAMKSAFNATTKIRARFGSN
ncbi:MAG TPA: ester cyclase [Thermoleophilaceae bacterium]|nr:ester cyclase [Thermoleophilaceae bacterium]